jgi:hypothetical protein
VNCGQAHSQARELVAQGYTGRWWQRRWPSAAPVCTTGKNRAALSLARLGFGTAGRYRPEPFAPIFLAIFEAFSSRLPACSKVEALTTAGDFITLSLLVCHDETRLDRGYWGNHRAHYFCAAKTTDLRSALVSLASVTQVVPPSSVWRIVPW